MPTIDLPLEQLKKYKPPLTKRKDFSQFWEENIKRSKEQLINAKVKEVSYPVRRLRTYHVTFDGFMDETPISAWLIRPDEEDPMPAMLFFHGYGGNKGQISDYLAGPCGGTSSWPSM